jgi:hypothetical protein
MSETTEVMERDVEYHHQIEDAYDSDKKIGIKAQVSNRHLLIGIDGHGDFCETNGFPIVLEHEDGECRLLVWADINSEEPTHVIPLKGARENARKSD